MQGKALNAKYSVSYCLPFPSGTLPPPELFTADLEDELKRLVTLSFDRYEKEEMIGE